MQNLAMLPSNHKAAQISELLADLDHWEGRLTAGSYRSNQLLFWLVARNPQDVWDECGATTEHKARTLTYEDMSVLLLELGLERESDQQLNAYRPSGGNSGNHGLGKRGPRPGQELPLRILATRAMSETCSGVTPDMRRAAFGMPWTATSMSSVVVQEKKQKTDTGGKAKKADHYRCTITCALCSKHNHYQDECYYKQRLSAKLKSEAHSGGPGGKGTGNDNSDKGKGKSKGRGKGQEQGKGGGGGGPDKRSQDKNQDTSGKNANPTPGGTNREASGGQQNPGPRSSSKEQTQQGKGAKRGNKGGDESNPRKCSCFMWMAQKLRKKGFDVTCPPEF